MTVYSKTSHLFSLRPKTVSLKKGLIKCSCLTFFNTSTVSDLVFFYSDLTVDPKFLICFSYVLHLNTIFVVENLWKKFKMCIIFKN